MLSISVSKYLPGRFQAAVASYQGQIWVVGGCDAWNPLRSVEVYDTTKNTWTMGPSLSTPRRGCGLAVRKGNEPLYFETSYIFLLALLSPTNLL